MSVTEQIAKNLVNPEEHGPILKALISVLEEEGERELKEQIKQWVQEILEESPASEESKEV